MMRSQDVIARLACEDLMIQSYRLVDEGHARRVTELFTDDGRFTVTGSVEIGGKASLADFFQAREDDRKRHTRHCLSNLSFTNVSVDEATIRATLMLFVLDDRKGTNLSALADVEDHYRLEGESWRIAGRTTTVVTGGT